MENGVVLNGQHYIAVQVKDGICQCNNCALYNPNTGLCTQRTPCVIFDEEDNKHNFQKLNIND